MLSRDRARQKGDEKMSSMIISEKNETSTNAASPEPKLSIIIPAYNEEWRLPDTLKKITAWMQTITFVVEVLIVENGSRDRTTEIAESYARQFNNITVLHSSKGKGAAVREGMLHGKGEYLFICDADLSMPIAEVENFLPPCAAGYHIVIGSREAPGAKRYNEPFHRHLIGRVFNAIVRVLVVPDFDDTQCGFKLFQREVARDVFVRQTISGWTFDVEVIYLALRYGYRVTEVPIHWYFNLDSRVSILQDTWQMFYDLVRIRLNGRRCVYDRRSNFRTTVQE
jgi:glycosyltransferase involved in cell wall biosynthesis